MVPEIRLAIVNRCGIHATGTITGHEAPSCTCQSKGAKEEPAQALHGRQEGRSLSLFCWGTLVCCWIIDSVTMTSQIDEPRKGLQEPE